MNIIDATRMTLLYTGYEKEEVNKIVQTICAFKPDLITDAPKSVRLINSPEDLSSVAAQSYAKEMDVACSGMDVYEYNIRAEKGYRIAAYSKNFKKCYAVRIFTDSATFNRFKGNNKVSVIDSFYYNTACILVYHAGDSNVDRYAIFAPTDMRFDEDAFIRSIVSTVAPTGYFAK